MNEASRYGHVFRPIDVSPVTLRNRIFVPANRGKDNRTTDRHVASHQAHAASDAAMLVFEGVRVRRSTAFEGHEAGRGR